ncbi:MAG TPA: hypothetical protein VN887_11770 [Candidatus Angelobacter sp.]|jgi:hypothetical protein|nr:hypothetical protein [Candidatus Angelobacter sp.]
MSAKLRSRIALANKVFADDSQCVGIAPFSWYGRCVKQFFAPNLDGKGRLVRALYGGVMIAAAWYLNRTGHPWFAGGAVLAGGFAWIEAARGWCVARACGIKTRW